MHQPIAMLPVVASRLDDTLAQAEASRSLYREMLDRPQVLDDALVARMLAAVAKEEISLPIYEEQIARWAREEAGHDVELARLRGVIGRTRIALADLRAVVEALAKGTIERTLDAIDGGFGIDERELS